MSHTPLPWKVIGNSVYQTYVAGAHEVVGGNAIKGRECCIGRQAASEEIKANTHLIVRACNSHAELLGALIALVHEASMSSIPEDASPIINAKEAIAKAKS